ncbi:hypothetical protein KC19_9G139100 [Ceratodon purpureus]|uniref:NB-ARC domain-containing protein n=1 Tax=Ceratodon purpureus TaxID=3225 RepID=A0A8T0GVA3_CERPU|nr:hypothetical protein KC19_9G139100 [Ceratodon purpureus]
MLTKGSMCIVTTRNRRVVEKLNNFDMKKAVHVHNVQGLGSEDSEHVFASYAFGGYWNDKPPGFEELVAKISEACRGVPLVLKVCGALLKGREDASFWNEVLKELRRGTFDDDGRRIFECLMISYNALPQECQEMFLDIACALLGKPKDMAILAWKSHGWSPIKGIEILVERALVTVDNSGGFKMHDHVRDMGRQIVREQRSKGVVTRLSMPESLEYLRQNEGFPESLEILIIFNVDSSSLCSLDTSHMKKLRILMFDDTIAPTSIPESLCWCHLYGLWFNRCFKESATIVMRTLPTPLPNSKLVVLSLAGSHITMLPEIVVRLSSLEVLNLKGCEKRCFLPESKPCLLPESFGGLKKLRDLDLEASGIISLPKSFGELSNLEVLNLRRCRELYMLPESFGGLRKLRDLNLEGSGIRSLPASFGKLSNLEVLNPGTLYLLPESFGGARKLRGLNLKGSRIRSLPASFGELINLEVLNLWQCRMLLFLPKSFGGLRKLQDLNLDGSGIRSLPSSFGELSNLEVLDLRRCTELHLLPESFGGLKKLQDLNLDGSGIRSLPSSFGELSNLEVLDLRRCTELHLLPESFGGLRKLRDLNLEGSGITSLPASFGELSNLEVLDLRGCKKLLFLPSSLTGLKNVKNFGYSGSAFEKLLQTLGCLTGFEESSVSLKLNTLQNLLGIMKTQKELMLEFFAIEALPESFGELSNLEVLNLRGCRELQLLPESFGSLRMLRDLDLDGTGITSLPASFGKLSNLEVLNLRGCWKLFVLPESFWGLNKLQDLNLGATGIRSLPSSFGEVSNLVVLNLEGCRIPSLPAVFGELSNLEVLNLSRCRELHLLPESFGVLKKLRDLNLKASGIRSLPSSFGKLSNLVVLNLEGCKISSLSASFGELSNLEMLNLRGCEELHLMPPSSGGLRKLRDLELSPYHEAFRDEILGLPASFGELSNLEMLNLLQCWELQLLPESFGGLR